MKVAPDLLVGTERHPGDADELVGPSRSHLRRRAQLAPVFGEAFDVRDLIRCVGLEEALEPRLARLLVGGRCGDDLYQRVYGVVHRSADGPG